MTKTQTETIALAAHPTIGAALRAIAGEMPTIPKRGSAKLGKRGYRYAMLADILTAVRPLLARHGVAFTQEMDILANGQVVLRTNAWIDCADGGTDERSSVYPMDWKGSHHDRGSEMTYARRYSIAALFGLEAEEDDDGHRAVAHDRGAPAMPPGPPPTDPGPPPAPPAQAAPPTEGRRPKDPSWAKDRPGFCARLNSLGTSYEEIAEACDEKDWSHPAYWPQRKRDGLIRNLTPSESHNGPPPAWGIFGLTQPRQPGDEA